MVNLDIYVVKERITKARIYRKVSKSKMERDGVVTRRQLIRIEDLNDPNFISLAKLMDIPSYLRVSVDYLLGLSEIMEFKNIVSYKDLFETLINVFDTGLVEFEIIKSDSASFFYMKSYDKKIIEFVEGYKKIVSLKETVDIEVYDKFLSNYLKRFDVNLG